MASSFRNCRALRHVILHPSYHSHVAVRSVFSSATRLQSAGASGWFDKIKGVFTGKSSSDPKSSSFTLTQFADQMEKARALGSFRKFQVGRCSEATVSDSFKKHSAILRYLGSVDPTGENIQNSHKQDAVKHCNCTIADVEHILAKYAWANAAQKKIEKLKEEGKPIPKNFNEMQKLMGSTPLDLGKENMAKNGNISRNAACPCGSGKRYKRCCGES